MTAEVDKQNIDSKEEFAKAERGIQRLLNNRLLTNGSANDAQFLASGVAISTGLDNSAYAALGGQDQLEILRFTLKDPAIEVKPLEVKEAALKVLAEIPVLKDVVAFDSPEQHVAKMKAQLQEFKTKGADISDKLLEWRGFNEKAVDTWRGVEDHALNINQSEFGYNVSINIPNDVKKVAENIRARLPEIKKMLAERVIKYKGAADEATKATIRQKIEQMNVELTFNESQDVSGGGVVLGGINLQFASPEQVLARKNKDVPGTTPPDQLTLTNTNILTSLTPEQTGKAFGRAVLFSGDTAADIFPLIAGREDMKRVIGKALTKFKSEHPEQAQAVDGFLSQDDFKDHDQWNKPKGERVELKKFPMVNKDPAKPGEMTIDLTLPKGKAYEAVQAIAKLDPIKEVAASEQKFAQVNNVELVGIMPQQGVISLEAFKTAKTLVDTLKEMQGVMQQIAVRGKTVAPVSSAEQVANDILQMSQVPTGPAEQMEGYANQLVAHVVEANNAIEQAGGIVPQTVALPIQKANSAIMEALKAVSKGMSWKDKLAARSKQNDGPSIGAA